VVLTLNIEPPTKAAELKGLLSAEALREYRSRRVVAIRQYGFHPFLSKMEHHAAGKLPAEQYVAVTDMLAFAQAMGWSDLEPFARGITGQEESLSVTGSLLAATAHVDPEFQELGKGDRYTIVRMGAILTLLERWLSMPGGQIPPTMRRGDTLNLTELARQAHALIAEKAIEHDKTSFSAFGIEAMRKQFSESKRELDDYFV
jgi:hypothetical protein